MDHPPSARYRPSPLVDPSVVGDRAILYHRVSRKAVVLNPTGTVLWTLLSAPRTEAELADSLVERFPALDAQQSRADAARFVASLVAEGLLDVAE